MNWHVAAVEYTNSPPVFDPIQNLSDERPWVVLSLRSENAIEIPPKRIAMTRS